MEGSLKWMKSQGLRVITDCKVNHETYFEDTK